MDKSAIMEFAGIYLRKNKHLTIPALQRFIKNRDEVGKAIKPEEIEEALSMLYCGGFINIAHHSEEGIVYVKDKS